MGMKGERFHTFYKWGADKNLDFHRAPKGAFYVFKTAEN